MEKKIKSSASKIFDNISDAITEVILEGMAGYYSSNISKEIMQNLKKIIKEDSRWKV